MIRQGIAFGNLMLYAADARTGDLPQRVLDVGTLNSLRQISLGHDLVVQNGCRHHVLQTVIGLFFCAYDGLVAFLAAADYVVGHVKNLDLDPLDALADDMVLVFKFKTPVGDQKSPAKPLQDLIVLNRMPLTVEDRSK